MDSVQLGVEVLRRTCDDFTGKKFIYANQDHVTEYPVGVLSRLSEVRHGLPMKLYVNGVQIIRQFVDVPVQIDYITSFDQTKPGESMFSPRKILADIQAGYYGDSWYSYFLKNKQELSSGVSLQNIRDLQGPIKVEGGENLWSARMVADLSVINETQTKDFPCLTEDNILPLSVKFDLKGKVKGPDSEGNFVSDDSKCLSTRITKTSITTENVDC